jgi:hypothetical protein
MCSVGGGSCLGYYSVCCNFVNPGNCCPTNNNCCGRIFNYECCPTGYACGLTYCTKIARDGNGPSQVPKAYGDVHH